MRPNFESVRRPVNIFFMRHGESEGNRLGILQGHEDPPLTDDGQAQATRAGEWFQNRGVERVFCSPLSRAHHTARIVSEKAELPVPEVLPDLIELDIGKFSGLTRQEIERKYPLEWRSFRLQSWDGVDGAESSDKLYRRACRVWTRILKEAEEGADGILCVSHGGLLQWIIRASMAGPDQSWLPLYPASNCGIFHFFLAPALPDEGFYAQWKHLNLIV